MKKALMYLLLFIGIQLVGGAIVPMIWQWISGTADKTIPLIITMTMVVSIITIAVFLFCRWAEVLAFPRQESADFCLLEAVLVWLLCSIRVRC